MNFHKNVPTASPLIHVYPLYQVHLELGLGGSDFKPGENPDISEIQFEIWWYLPFSLVHPDSSRSAQAQSFEFEGSIYYLPSKTVYDQLYLEVLTYHFSDKNLHS